MQEYIIDKLDAKSEDFKLMKRKQKYVDDVIDSYTALTSCKNFNDLRQHIAGVFDYRYVNCEGSKVSFKLNSKHNYTWIVSKNQHHNLAMINKNGILTFDSMNATERSKAGIMGIIEGKNIIKLQEFILTKYPNTFTMSSFKIVNDTFERETLINILTKYQFEGPFYDINEDLEDYSRRKPGYYSFYNGKPMFECSFDDVINTILRPDPILSKELGIDDKKYLDTIRKDFFSRDLHVVSFLGNKLKDNSLFSALAEFRPSDINISKRLSVNI